MKRRSQSRRSKALLPRRNLTSIVRHYISEYRDKSALELRFFAIQRTLAAAIEKAALAQRPDGKRLDHQRRIPSASLEESHRRLASIIGDLESAASFHELFDIIDNAIRDVPNIGELTIYDITLRIAAWRRLQPDAVYLHAGTREGAKALGLDIRRTCVPIKELPSTMRTLHAHEIEDVLCIYKDILAGDRLILRKPRC